MNQAATLRHALLALVALVVVIVPGTAPLTAATPADFNYLESAVIDADTGQVELFGRMADAGPAETIPYAQVLGDALVNPGPQFSLESDMGEFSKKSLAGKSLDELLFDRQGKLSPFGEETMQILGVPIPERGRRAETIASLLRQAGFSLAVDLREAIPESGVSSDTLTRWIELLALVPEFEAFRAANDDAARDEFYGRLVQGLSDSLGSVDSPVLARYRTSRAEGSAPDPALKLAILAFIASYDRLVGPATRILLARRDLPAVVYTADDLSRAFGARPVSRPRFIQLDPSTALARLLFEGDYALKSVPFDMSLLKVPGFDTFPRWAETYMSVSDLGSQRDTRYWITVEGVDLRESPEGDAVTIGEVRLKVESRTKESDQPWNTEQVDPITKAYADLLTEHYDAIARQVPALYNLRETAKVVALANWVRGKDGVAPPAGGRKWDAPDEVPGFLAMMPYDRDDRVIWGVWPSGGVDFDFSSKIVVTKDPELSSDAVRSATPRTPLDGRWDALMGPVNGEGLASREAQRLRVRLETAIEEVRRTRSLVDRMGDAGAAEDALNEFLWRTQKLQVTALREAISHANRAAEALHALDAAVPQWPEAERTAFLDALEAAALDPAPGATGRLRPRARELYASVLALDTTQESYRPEIQAQIESIAGGKTLAQLVHGLGSWVMALDRLRRDEPELFESVARRSPTLTALFSSTDRSDNALHLFAMRQGALSELAPQQSTGGSALPVAERVLDEQLSELADTRRELEALRG